MAIMGQDGVRPMQRQGEEWREEYSTGMLPQVDGNLPWGMLVTGAVVVGLGVLLWNYLGPDVRRYMKIKSM